MSYDPWYDGNGRGNGYDYEAGMSHNAVMAYERGVKPLSKITADNLKAVGWTETKALAMRLAKDHNVWRSHEWHHSGGDWYNRVDFYDPSDLVEAWTDLTETQRQTLRTPEPAQVVEIISVSGSYVIWGGSRRHPRKVGREIFTGTLKGDWIYLDGGGRKKASGKHISWRRED